MRWIMMATRRARPLGVAFGAAGGHEQSGFDLAAPDHGERG